MSEPDNVVLKVSAGSDARKVGSTIAHCLAENKKVTLRAIGAGAVNQSQKAIAIATQWTAPRGQRLASIPGFTDVPNREATNTISAMTFQILVV